MRRHEWKRKVSAPHLLEQLRDFVRHGGVAARADIQLFLRMCLKAEELRKVGLKARVRGEQHRWLVVIDGRQSLGRPVSFASQTRLEKFHVQRRVSSVLCRIT